MTHCFLIERATQTACFVEEHELWNQVELDLASLSVLTNKVASGQF